MAPSKQLQQLLFYLRSLTYGLTDGELICACARSLLRSTEQEKRFGRTEFMNENADIIVQLPAELRVVYKETVHLWGC